MYVDNPGMSGSHQSEFQKLRASQTHKGKITSEDTKKLLMAHTKETDLEWYEHVCEANKHQWENPSYVKAVMEAREVKPNKTELRLEKIVFPFGFWFVGDGKLIVGGKLPDYWNGDHKLIELFGDFWHKGEDPQIRIDFFKRYGYDTLVIWEHELENLDKKENLDKILIKVSNFCQTGGDD